MPKTYNSLTVGNAAAGSAILASDHAKAFENINNYRVPPMCINERTGQAVADATVTAIAFTSAASVDTDSIHSTSTNNTRFTPTTAGIYMVSGNLTITAGGLVQVVTSLVIRKNGAGELVATGGVANIYANPSLAATCLVSMNGTTDYVELIAYQDNTDGTNKTFTGRMFLAWVGQVS